MYQPGQGEQRADRAGAEASSTRSPDGAGRRSKPSTTPGRGGEGITMLGEERYESTGLGQAALKAETQAL